MRFLSTLVMAIAAIGVAFANPQRMHFARDDATLAADAGAPEAVAEAPQVEPVVADPPDKPSKCDKCDRKYESCMNHWYCWVPGANCRPTCIGEVCEIEDCRQGCGWTCS
ncbi:hypothetical protein N0V90_000938 [Kalmusia sp. IMI 367209]|nr:hypothetical protein N0V90_000938 [Kalmusia sp. IMI 367209]